MLLALQFIIELTTEPLFKYKSGLCQLTCLSSAGPRLVLITLRDLRSPHTREMSCLCEK